MSHAPHVRLDSLARKISYQRDETEMVLRIVATLMLRLGATRAPTVSAAVCYAAAATSTMATAIDNEERS